MKSLLSITFASLIATTVIIALPSIPAQEPIEPPAEIAKFREAFENASEMRSEPARETFAAALAQLAHSRAEGGDYEGAIRARDRRLTLLETAAGATTGGASRPGGEIVIDLPSGIRAGSGAKYDAKGGKFVGFSKAGQSIRWEVSKTEPGIYSVIITYSCGEPVTDEFGETILTGGSFTLEEVTSLSTTGSEPLRRTVLPTGGWNKSVSRNIGKLAITGSRLTLRLSVSDANPGELMHLYGIRLVPVEPDTGSEGASDDTPPELAKLRMKFRSAISGNTSSLIMAYGSALKLLRETLADANDLEAAYEAQKEFDAAEKLSKDPSLIIDSKVGS